MCVDRQIALFCHFRVCVRFAQFVTKMLRTKRATHVTSPPNVVTGPANKSSTRRHANDSRGAGYLEHLIAFWGALANQNISSIQLRVSNKRKNTVHRGFVACRRTALSERVRCGWLKWPPFMTHTKKTPTRGGKENNCRIGSVSRDRFCHHSSGVCGSVTIFPPGSTVGPSWSKWRSAAE